MNRPYNNFKTAITDDIFFVGRSLQIEQIISDPFQVHVLLGGRRIGKSSTMRAVERRLLSEPKTPKRAFPIYIDLNFEQPKGVDNFRYTLILRFKQAFDRWKAVKTAEFRELYRSFLSQITNAEISLAGFAKFKISNPDYTCQLRHDDFKAALNKILEEVRADGFCGVCFILDEADFIVRNKWANDLWSYIRGLMDSDMTLKPYLGFILTGYRHVREYQQRVGSPLLNIANVEWLTAISDEEGRNLIKKRFTAMNIKAEEQDIIMVLQLSGGHPYLLQQLINLLFEELAKKPTVKKKEFVQKALRMTELKSVFSGWWKELREHDQKVYQEVLAHGPCGDNILRGATQLPLGEIQESIEVLMGTGMILKVDDGDQFTVSGELFKTWVTSH